MTYEPIKFFQKPPPEEIERRKKLSDERDMSRYGCIDYSNEKYDEAWKTLKDNDHLPVGPERSAAVDKWQKLMTEGDRIDNIDAARHRQQTRERLTAREYSDPRRPEHYRVKLETPLPIDQSKMDAQRDQWAEQAKADREKAQRRPTSFFQQKPEQERDR